MAKPRGVKATPKGKGQPASGYLTSRQITWLLLEALLPLALIFVIFWPIGSWAITSQNSLYERYFGSGDLIAVSITLLCPAIVRLYLIEGINVNSKEFRFAAILTILAIIGSVLYGVIKIIYLQYPFPENSPPESQITEMTNFSFGFLAMSLGAIFAATGMEN